MEIELMSVPRIRMALLQSLAENILSIAGRHGQLQTEINIALRELEIFKSGMQRHTVSATDKIELNKVRDRMIAGFFHQVRSEQCFPYETPDAQTQLASLVALEKKYGIAITRLPNDEQSAAIENFLSEAKLINLSLFSNGHLNEWVPLITDANNKYKEAAQGYVAESAIKSNISPATTQSPILTNALNALLTKFFAFVQISNDENMTKSYRELQVLINSVK